MAEFAQEAFIEDVSFEEGLDGGEGISQTEERERANMSEYVVVFSGTQMRWAVPC